MGSGLKKVGGVASTIGHGVLGVAMMVAVLLVAALLLRGMVWASEKALPWLVTGSEWALLFCVVVLLPLCIFRKTRPWAGVGFYIASYLFGVMLFAFSCIVAVELWGYTGLFVGLILGGVGVMPVAFLAALFKREWFVMLCVAIGVVLTFGTRFLGIYLSTLKPALAQQAEQELLFGEETAEYL